MHALVTGGAGFIGSHLIERLIEDGHKVTVLDRFNRGQEKYREIWGKKVTLIQADISLANEVQVLSLKEIDWVFHLAGRNQEVDLQDDPAEYHKINVKGTINILEMARKLKIRKFVYAASASCYGNFPKLPSSETSPVIINNPHALSKYLGELYVLNWGKIYKLPVVSLRIFSVYGPPSKANESFGPLFTKLMRQKMQGEPFLLKKGEVRRDLIFITDVIEAFIRAAKTDIINDVFNVAGGRTYTLGEIAEYLGGEVAYRKEKIKHDVSWGDITKIKKTLGWSPKTSITDGIKLILKSL